jgi:hypothetical protein
MSVISVSTEVHHTSSTRIRVMFVREIVHKKDFWERRTVRFIAILILLILVAPGRFRSSFPAHRDYQREMYLLPL